MRDRRFWYPDESCRWWNWETAADLGNDANYGQFRVSSGLVGVIAGYLANVSTGIDKSVASLILLDGTGQATGIGMQLNGAIQEVQELGSDGLNYPGIVLMAQAGVRPCRIPLRSDLYVVRCRNWSGTAVARLELQLFGWLWEQTPRV